MTVRAQIWEERRPDEPGYLTRQWASHGDHRCYVDSRGDPAMKLARILVAAGEDPAQPYEVCRGDRVALTFRSLGWAAEHTVVETVSGPRFRLWDPVDLE